jgi:hypothetical protein
MKVLLMNKIVLFAGMLLLGIVAPMNAAMTINETADMLYVNSSGTWEYIHEVDKFVNENIEYRHDGKWSIKTLDLVWKTRSGDCSEMAILKTAMLIRNGVDAKVIHGYIPGGMLHDTVEIKAMGFPAMWIDRRSYPGFHKTGDGIAPGEFFVDVEV